MFKYLSLSSKEGLLTNLQNALPDMVTCLKRQLWKEREIIQNILFSLLCINLASLTFLRKIVSSINTISERPYRFFGKTQSANEEPNHFKSLRMAPIESLLLKSIICY